MAYKGLLVTPEDKKEAAFNGLLKLGANLMAAGGYSDKPVSFGQAMASGVQGFNSGYQDHLSGVKQDKFQNMQATSAQQQIDMNQSKMDAAKAAAEHEKRLVEWRKNDGKDQFGNPIPIPMTGADVMKEYQDYYNGEDNLRRQMHLQNFIAGLKPSGPQYETIQNPFGKGGVGQRNSQTGKIENYQAPAKSDGLKMTDIVDLEFKLGDRFKNDAKSDLQRVEGYKSLEAIWDNPAEAAKGAQTVNVDGKQFQMTGQGAADIALIFGFMKMLDPASVVRETEFSTAADTSGKPEYVVNALNRVLSGDRLGEKERLSLMRQARNQYDAALKSANSKADTYRKQGGMYEGVNPERALSFYSPYQARIDGSMFALPSPPPEVPLSGQRDPAVDNVMKKYGL